MRILIVGSGAREHAIAWKLAQNPLVEKVCFSTHNGGAKGKLENLNLPDNAIGTIIAYLENNLIDLVIIGPENPLKEGIVDHLQSMNIPVFGPTMKAANLEASKSFAKAFMKKYDIPTADYLECHTLDAAKKALSSFGFPVVIKADGLCAGKGVFICQNESEARQVLKEIFVDQIFASEGSKVVIESYLKGFEASLLCFVSGTKLYPFDTAMDYKKIYEADKGPNTGGVGSISPNPYWTKELQQRSDAILEQIELGLKNENLSYAGILFIGYMVQDGKIYVLEFNTRFGDPETQVLLPRLNSDFLKNIQQALRFEPVKLSFDQQVCMNTVLVSEGYPGCFERGYQIKGLENLPQDILVFHNGTRQENDVIFSAGGRVLSVAALRDTLDVARQAVYTAIPNINFENMSFRKDIGLLNTESH